MFAFVDKCRMSCSERGVGDETDSRPLRLHICAPMGAASGNLTTASRIAHLLQQRYPAAMLHVELHDTNGPSPSSDADSKGFPTVNGVIEHEEAVLCIHAYRAAPWMQYFKDRCPHYRVLVFGGTDVNECGGDKGCDRSRDDVVEVMSQCVASATALVCFSTAVADAASIMWPGEDIKSKMVIVPQSVQLPNHPHPSPKEGLLRLLQACTLTSMLDVASMPRQAMEVLEEQDADARWFLALLPAGLRAVKDPLFAPRAFLEHLDGSGPRVFLVISGPPIDLTVEQELKDLVESVPSSSCSSTFHLAYSPGVSPDVLIAAMQHPSVLCTLNTSLSEGQPQAAMEAMAVGCPVVVRNVPGNAAVISHGKNGLLFDTKAELVDRVATLARWTLDEQLHSEREAIVSRAKRFIGEAHDAEVEALGYAKVLGLAV